MNKQFLVLTLLLVASNLHSMDVNLQTEDVVHKIKIKTLVEKYKLWRKKTTPTQICVKRIAELNTKRNPSEKATARLADLGACYGKLLVNHPHQYYQKRLTLFVKFCAQPPVPTHNSPTLDQASTSAPPPNSPNVTQPIAP